MNFANLHIEGIESMPFAENSYVAWLDDSTDCVVLDPGLEPGKILAFLARRGLTPKAILNTHGHSDHIAGNETLKVRWPDAPLIIGVRDADKLTDPDKNLSAPFGLPLTSPAADQTVRQGDVCRYAGLELEVLDTPGHSIGHVVFLLRGQDPWVLFAGDVLFDGSVGRTDFPDGDSETLIQVIHNKLFTLTPETVVLPGHGPPTTIGREIADNPFVGYPAGYRE